MRLELVIHLSREDREALQAVAAQTERLAVAAEDTAASLASIDGYFKRLNRATEAHIIVGKISEQEAP